MGWHGAKPFMTGFPTILYTLEKQLQSVLPLDSECMHQDHTYSELILYILWIHREEWHPYKYINIYVHLCIPIILYITTYCCILYKYVTSYIYTVLQTETAYNNNVLNISENFSTANCCTLSI